MKIEYKRNQKKDILVLSTETAKDFEQLLDLAKGIRYGGKRVQYTCSIHKGIGNIALALLPTDCHPGFSLR